MVLVLLAWCLSTLLTIFQLYRDGQFYLEEETEVPVKTTDLPEVGFVLTTLVVRAIDRTIRMAHQ
jgi:hypothetical protein